MNNKTIPIITMVASMIILITANIPTVNASSTYADGQRAGKAQGHRDAINGESPDDDCGEDHSNDYCTAYKIAYNIEYHWTRLVQDQR